MTPSEAISMLDRQIAPHGQPVGFKRGSTIQSASGFVRGYKPDELVGLLTQADRKVTVSPTSLGSYVPKANDEFVTNGALGTVIAAEPIQMGTTTVRWNLTVRMM
jgi:exosome complex RNA-binding protein Rrp4